LRIQRNKMINPDYYKTLLDKYAVVIDCHKTALLTTEIIWANYNEKKIHFNFSKIDYVLEKTVNQLYTNLSNNIFRNNAEFPPLQKGDLVRKIGIKGNAIFSITNLEGNNVRLILVKGTKKVTKHERFMRYDFLIKNYLPITQRVSERTLAKYKDYFSKINEHGFLPTFFSKKIVLIATKTMWDKLDRKNCIPSVYLPNTKEENQTVLKSIPALEDCIIYVTPKYEVCYEQILNKKHTIDTIIVCDTDKTSIPQIIQDQGIYNFKLIVLTNDYEPQIFNDLIFWDWKKEEIELIENINFN
jgi:hypothetical protein